MFSRPMDMRVLTNLKKQVQLFGEERIVILQFQTKQWERFDKRTATNNQFRSASREQVESRKLLEHPHRISSAKDGYRTR